MNKPVINEEYIPDLKRGIKLPKSNSEWSTANEYFKFALQANEPITSHDLDSNIKSLFTDFKTSIITSEFRTPFIPVGRGVLQGDCLSPLLFNMCFNTFIQHIKTEKYRQFGFSFQFLNPIHWFQFADDAAVISSQESENQHLLNRFSIWCRTFGIKKALTKFLFFYKISPIPTETHH